mmetsp:Transcript_21661/g.37299  ORF Transcript_21661/g.37299 Transcript_21661/m.37299 type:complete len:207 (-) Transcript_21661:1624-2244(-)
MLPNPISAPDSQDLTQFDDTSQCRSRLIRKFRAIIEVSTSTQCVRTYRVRVNHASDRSQANAALHGQTCHIDQFSGVIAHNGASENGIRVFGSQDTHKSLRLVLASSIGRGGIFNILGLTNRAVIVCKVLDILIESDVLGDKLFLGHTGDRKLRVGKGAPGDIQIGKFFRSKEERVADRSAGHKIRRMCEFEWAVHHVTRRKDLGI